MRHSDDRPAQSLEVIVGAFGGEAVQLDEQQVRVYPIWLDEPPGDFEELFECLTTEEQARARRYEVERARRQFVVGRATLRRVLGKCLQVEPVRVPIAYTGAGKPVLSDLHSGLHFNVTHTDGLALLALSRRPVGIDVERIRPLDNPDGLVRRFFSPVEQQTYLELPANLRLAGFFRAWTSKEALIKAAALSVAYLDEFDVELHPERPAALLAARHPALARCGWLLAAWEPVSGFTATVAVESFAQSDR